MSAVWKYFKVSDEDTKVAICNICSAKVSRGGAVPKNFSLKEETRRGAQRKRCLRNAYVQVRRHTLLVGTSAAAQLIETYLAELPIARSDNPLDYWREDRFPLLARIARRYLSAPSTSPDSERLFSAASHVLNEKRNRLSCQKAEQLLFLKRNLPLLLK